MKMLLSLAVMCLAIHSGMGAPLGRYMFVKCHPWGSSSNCVTHRSREMKLSTDLPVKLPASATQYICGCQEIKKNKLTATKERRKLQTRSDTFKRQDAQPVEEGPVRKQTEVESVMFPTDDGSGEGSAVLEGSAGETPTVEGSGDYWTTQDETAKADYNPAEEERSDDQLLDP